MTRRSDPALLVLHAVRVLGYAATPRITTRVSLPASSTQEHLLDAQAHGWITWSSFGDDGGWSLTENGRAHGEHLLAVELDASGARRVVEDAYDLFLSANDHVARVCTAWQMYEMGIETGRAPLTTTLSILGDAAEVLRLVETRLGTHLERFAGYHARFSRALRQASADQGWITGTDRESAHHVWFELHEDLIATLGLSR